MMKHIVISANKEPDFEILINEAVREKYEILWETVRVTISSDSKEKYLFVMARKQEFS